jgi:hypothetical protein
MRYVDFALLFFDDMLRACGNLCVFVDLGNTSVASAVAQVWTSDF